MRTEHTYLDIEFLTKEIGNIEFPEFQREPTVWKLDKKRRLIDSILRDFDISSIYFFENTVGRLDCIDGRQRLNAIFSYLGINEADEDDNGFNLEIENEIFDDGDRFQEAQGKRFKGLPDLWKKKILEYKLNTVLIKEVDHEEELNLLFLRLQIASVLNAGEKLHAMTGQMRDSVFQTLRIHPFFEGIRIPERRFAREQVAAQILLNVYSLMEIGLFARSRYVDLQDFFKTHSSFDDKDKQQLEKVVETLDLLVSHFEGRLAHIKNRALAVSVYLYVRHLTEGQKESDIGPFAEFFLKLLKTLKWQIPKVVEMDLPYHDLLRFQTNITQAAPERYAIERRHAFLDEYFEYYRQHGKIKGDTEFHEKTGQDPEVERDKVSL